MTHKRWHEKLRVWAFSQVPEDDSDASEKAVRKISSDWWGVGVGAAVVGYFCGDYFAFFPPMDRAALGFIFLLGINVLHRSLSTRVNWKRTALLVPVLERFSISLDHSRTM